MEHVRLRRRDPSAELKALAATVVVLGLVLGGAWWLVKHRPPPPSAAAEAPGRSSASDPIVIEVNGEPIYRSEFDAAIASLPPQMRAQVASEESRRQVAEELVKMKLLEQQARRMGLDDENISGRVAVMRGNLLASAALQKLVRDSKPLTIEELYARNQERFESARVRSILLPYQGSRATPRQGQAPPPPQVMAKARQLVGRLRRGESFEKIAAAESVGNPDLGEVRRGTFMPELDRAIFNTPVGQFTEPVQSPFGIHIFQIIERKAPKLDEVRPLLEREAQNLQAAAIVEDLRRNAKVEYKNESKTKN